MKHLIEINSTSEAEQKDYTVVYYANDNDSVIIKAEPTLTKVWYKDGTMRTFDYPNIIGGLVITPQGEMRGTTDLFGDPMTIEKIKFGSIVTSIDSLAITTSVPSWQSQYLVKHTIKEFDFGDMYSETMPYLISGATTKVIFPKGLKIIPAYSLNYSIENKVLRLPSTIETIDGAVLEGSQNKDNVEKIYLPNSIKKMYSNSFAYFTNLKEVIYKGVSYTKQSELMDILHRDGVIPNGTVGFFSRCGDFSDIVVSN